MTGCLGPRCLASQGKPVASCFGAGTRCLVCGSRHLGSLQSPVVVGGCYSAGVHSEGGWGRVQDFVW